MKPIRRHDNHPMVAAATRHGWRVQRNDRTTTDERYRRTPTVDRRPLSLTALLIAHCSSLIVAGSYRIVVDVHLLLHSLSSLSSTRRSASNAHRALTKKQQYITHRSSMKHKILLQFLFTFVLFSTLQAFQPRQVASMKQYSAKWPLQQPDERVASSFDSYGLNGSADDLGPDAPPPGFLRREFPNLPWRRLPNILTFLRCLAIPGLTVLFYLPERHIECGILFALASFTDWLDGYLARRWDISSEFGAFLDPVADKLMVSTILILLSGRYGGLVAVPTAVILAREIAVSALREWMAQKGKRDIVKVGFQGKLKTALTMLSLAVFLFVPASGVGALASLKNPAIVLLYSCALITVTSGSLYFRAAAPYLLS